MKEFIKELIEKQEICGLYLDPKELLRFSVGYILKADDNFFIVESIDPNGKADGIFCDSIKKIVKIEARSKYCMDIKELFDYYNQERYCFPLSTIGTLKSILDFAKTNRKLCTIELCDSENKDAIGFITQIQDQNIKMESISEEGINDGWLTFFMEDISHVSIDSAEEKKIFDLYNLKHT